VTAIAAQNAGASAEPTSAERILLICTSMSEGCRRTMKRWRNVITGLISSFKVRVEYLELHS
jgi:hypothetical protein